MGDALNWLLAGAVWVLSTIKHVAHGLLDAFLFLLVFVLVFWIPIVLFPRLGSLIKRAWRNPAVQNAAANALAFAIVAIVALIGAYLGMTLR